MKRKVLFLQYILQQEKTSMVYSVFQATCENRINNDFVKTCEKYLQTLGIVLTFEEIREMSTFTFKKIVREKSQVRWFPVPHVKEK